MSIALDRSILTRNEHLTFRANMGVGRHGWLRLTPAYGVRLVRDKISHMPAGSIVTDPFSGTGTTPLAAAEIGHFGQSVDVNPFLIWMGRAKVRHYSEHELDATIDAGQQIVSSAGSIDRDADLWQPNLFKIEKWWSAANLHALKVLRSSIDTQVDATRDLLDIAFCRTLIARSNAAFNHQSMSFKDVSEDQRRYDTAEFDATVAKFRDELAFIIESAQFDLSGSAEIHHGDSRDGFGALKEADLILTSPPYVNRMSYIRELRPYMYWLRYLDQASDAGDLDWRAIGGTWGTATSKLNTWTPDVETPIDTEMKIVTDKIAADGGKNGPLLATYVRKYHHDMWKHFVSIKDAVRVGGEVSYIIGNSTFYKHEVPAHEWYGSMLRALDFEDVRVDVIRKRNSNKALFEYDVQGVRR